MPRARCRRGDRSCARQLQEDSYAVPKDLELFHKLWKVLAEAVRPSSRRLHFSGAHPTFTAMQKNNVARDYLIGTALVLLILAVSVVFIRLMGPTLVEG